MTILGTSRQMRQRKGRKRVTGGKGYMSACSIISWPPSSSLEAGVKHMTSLRQLFHWYLTGSHQSSKHAIFKKIFILFICAYNVWVISPPSLRPLPYPPPPLPPLTPRYPAKTILPLSLLLLKTEYKQ
jgi:hypothetical protein